MATQRTASGDRIAEQHAESTRIRSLVDAACEWFRKDARPLPWREPGTSPWGILVSEILSHQTQIARVVPKWLEFMERWPTPAALAADTDAAILAFWDRLGYPRRALALRRCAITITQEYGGAVPSDPAQLRTLPGIGEYTAGAVASFAYRMRIGAVDTNVRRVLARAVCGQADAWSPSMPKDSRAMALALPETGEQAAVWNAAAMELGALICRAKAPQCEHCPIVSQCAWQRNGKPASTQRPKRASARFAGSAREARGKVMALLREMPDGVSKPAVVDVLSYQQQFDASEILSGLERDGLISTDANGHVHLGSTP